MTLQHPWFATLYTVNDLVYRGGLCPFNFELGELNLTLTPTTT